MDPESVNGLNLYCYYNNSPIKVYQSEFENALKSNAIEYSVSLSQNNSINNRVVRFTEQHRATQEEIDNDIVF